MTAATYTWPVENILSNGELTDGVGSGPDFTDWTISGTVNVQTGRTGDAAEIDPSSKIYQIVPLVQYGSGAAFEGRNFDDELPMMLRFYAKPNTEATYTGVWKVQLHILDASDNEVYVYDWFQTKWVAETASFGGAAWWGRALASDDWALFTLPWVQAASVAGTDVDDTYKIRVSFECEATYGVQIDDVELIPWTGDVVAAKLGSTVVFANGYNFPVKYSPRQGVVSELSLIKPYETDNSPIPTTNLTTGGSLSVSKWYGWSYTFWDEELAEESGMPLAPGGDAKNTGAFYEELGSSDTKVELDFSGIEIPNTEETVGTDNTRITHIIVYRTLGQADEEAMEGAIASGLWHYEGRIELPTKTFDSVLSDDDLPDAGQQVRVVPPGTEVGAPAFGIVEAHNNRLYVAGGGSYRRGSAEPVSGNRVVGVVSGTDPYTDWSRATEWKYIQFDGEAQKYMVHRYAHATDGTASGHDELFLTQDYNGAYSGKTSYRIYPEPGLVNFCEEGQPTEWSSDGFFSLEGDEGGEVTLLQSSGDALVCCTRDKTFLWDQASFDIKATSYALPVSNGIGCIAPHSGAEVNGDAYWLASQGVIRRSQGGRPQIISQPIQSLFTDQDDPDYIERDPITQMANFARGVHYEPLQQYLLAVKTSNAKIGCDLVLAYNYFFETWDIFRLRSELMNWAWTADDNGNATLLMCDAFGGLHVWDTGTTDGAGNEKGGGLLVGQVVSATSLSVTVSATSALPTDGEGLKGSTFYIKSGLGAGQWRTIVRNDEDTVYFSEELSLTPDTTASFQIGSIEFEWNLKDSDLGQPTRVKTLRFLQVDHTSEGQGGLAEVRAFEEFGAISVDDRIESERDTALEPNSAKDPNTFDTAQQGRSQVSLRGASGYNLRLQIRCDGPEKPLTVRRLAASFQIRQSD